MIVYYMRGKHGHSCAGATHMTKVFVKRTILFLQWHGSLGRQEVEDESRVPGEARGEEDDV